MNRSKGNPLTDRLQAAATARTETTGRLRARPPLDDQEVVAKQVAHQAVSDACEARTAVREATRVIAEAERERVAAGFVRQPEDELERQAAASAEQKLARDARYAARRAKARR